jgi:formylglycine-generating enzyme required for sulfatase activity
MKALVLAAWVAISVVATHAQAKPLEVFRDCDVCPEMIELPLGEFVMGAPKDEFRGFRTIWITPRAAEGSYILANEGPQNKVLVDIPIAMAKNEVTIADWIACADDGWCGGGAVIVQDAVMSVRLFADSALQHMTNRPADTELLALEQKDLLALTREEGLRLVGRYPKNGVTYQDAQDYVGWLNWKTGTTAYRLPTEAEWEYAARAGTTTRFAQGFEPTPEQANISGKMTEFALEQKRPDLRTLEWPVPVDVLDAANPWGLRHMSGNVDEFTRSCFPDVGRFHDPLPDWDTTSEWLQNSYQEGCLRAIRGGSYKDGMDTARIAARNGSSGDLLLTTRGFRVLKELN